MHRISSHLFGRFCLCFVSYVCLRAFASVFGIVFYEVGRFRMRLIFCRVGLVLFVCVWSLSVFVRSFLVYFLTCFVCVWSFLIWVMSFLACVCSFCLCVLACSYGVNRLLYAFRFSRRCALCVCIWQILV